MPWNRPGHHHGGRGRHLRRALALNPQAAVQGEESIGCLGLPSQMSSTEANSTWSATESEIGPGTAEGETTDAIGGEKARLACGARNRMFLAKKNVSMAHTILGEPASEVWTLSAMQQSATTPA